MDLKEEICANFKGLLIESIVACNEIKIYPFEKKLDLFCETFKIEINIKLFGPCLKGEVIHIIQNQFIVSFYKNYNIAYRKPNIVYSFEIPSCVDMFYFDLTWMKITCSLINNQD